VSHSANLPNWVRPSLIRYWKLMDIRMGNNVKPLFLLTLEAFKDSILHMSEMRRLTGINNATIN
jgi:hypothetical protein